MIKFWFSKDCWVKWFPAAWKWLKSSARETSLLRLWKSRTVPRVSMRWKYQSWVRRMWAVKARVIKELARRKMIKFQNPSLLFLTRLTSKWGMTVIIFRQLIKAVSLKVKSNNQYRLLGKISMKIVKSNWLLNKSKLARKRK